MVAVDVHREAMTLFESKTISNLLWKRQAASSPQRRFRTLCPDFVRHNLSPQVWSRSDEVAAQVPREREVLPYGECSRGFNVPRFVDP